MLAPVPMKRSERVFNEEEHFDQKFKEREPKSLMEQSRDPLGLDFRGLFHVSLH